MRTAFSMNTMKTSGFLILYGGLCSHDEHLTALLKSLERESAQPFVGKEDEQTNDNTDNLIEGQEA